jgi:hypothetical protein
MSDAPRLVVSAERHGCGERQGRDQVLCARQRSAAKPRVHVPALLLDDTYSKRLEPISRDEKVGTKGMGFSWRSIKRELEQLAQSKRKPGAKSA